MRSVGVHLHESVVLVVREAPAEAGPIGHSQALLGRPVQHVDRGVGFGQPIGDPAGAVRRIVVDDENVGVGRTSAQLAHEPLDVLGLIEGRDDDQGRHRRRQPIAIETTPPAARAYAVQVPTSVAGVGPAARGTDAANVAGRCMGAFATTCPEASTMAEMPLVDGMSTHRPVSMARSREILNCCCGCDVPVKLALDVCTTSSCAPPATASSISPSNAMSQQMVSPSATPPAESTFG